MEKQILVAGNDHAIYQSFQNWMQSQDIEVSYVLSVAEALDSVLKCEYCLVVLSLQFIEAILSTIRQKDAYYQNRKPSRDFAKCRERPRVLNGTLGR